VSIKTDERLVCDLEVCCIKKFETTAPTTGCELSATDVTVV